MLLRLSLSSKAAVFVAGLLVIGLYQAELAMATDGPGAYVWAVQVPPYLLKPNMTPTLCGGGYGTHAVAPAPLGG